MVLLGFRYLASSIPLICLAGVAIGVGVIFAFLVLSICRNPSHSYPYSIPSLWSHFHLIYSCLFGFSLIFLYSLISFILSLLLILIYPWFFICLNTINKEIKEKRIRLKKEKEKIQRLKKEIDLIDSLIILFEEELNWFIKEREKERNRMKRASREKRMKRGSREKRMKKS